MRVLKISDRIKALLFFCLLVAGAVIFFFNEKENKPLLRWPAQFQKTSSAKDLKAFKRQLIQNLVVQKQSPRKTAIRVSIPDDICLEYQKFELVVEAEGVAVSGEPVQASITKSCQDLDPQSLEQEWVFSAAQRPENLDPSISKWNLKSLIFHPQQQDTKMIHVKGYEVISVLGAMPSVEF